MNVAPIVILAGPTAVGKTELACELALRREGVEILCADSLTVYRKFEIGTAKPSPTDRSRVPHHLIDIRSPHEAFSAGDFVRECNACLEDLRARKKRALIVGGSGFYIRALTHGLWPAPPKQPELRQLLGALSTPELYQRLHQSDSLSARKIGSKDRYRLIRAIEILELTGDSPSRMRESHAEKEPDPRFKLWFVDRAPDELQKRITQRTQSMVEGGLIEETIQIRNQFPNASGLRAVGYLQTTRYLDQIAPFGRRVASGQEGLKNEIELATRQLVKSQRTWFRNQKQAQTFLLDQDQNLLFQAFDSLYTSSE